MADINDALIRKVAELSRLKLEDGEIGNYVTSIGEILNHVNQLTRVNTDGVEPMFYGIDEALRLREDRVCEFPVDEEGKPKILKHAPLVEDGGFKVPQIVG
ncbi:MAG: Asp-tRNA(Asn)/Glu-tRNA(Gln) amidotransferase subunit GatC [Bdellovibrionales bacterium]|nr:Asp-tRNA(Asn)/Glu-tRNA(Gln) amidotransferase subunit GatC [Bdellovibrionales bacterium]